jgi:hypothetical protein
MCCHGTSRKLSFSHGQYITVFQAEVYAVEACAVEDVDRKYKNRNIYVLRISIEVAKKTVRYWTNRNHKRTLGIRNRTQTGEGTSTRPFARRRTNLLKLKRNQLRWVVGLLAGHWHLK